MLQCVETNRKRAAITLHTKFSLEQTLLCFVISIRKGILKQHAGIWTREKKKIPPQTQPIFWWRMKNGRIRKTTIL